MSSLARMRPTGVTPSPRLVGVVRATIFNDPNVKHGTDARAKRASIGTTACVSGFGVANFNGRNAQVDAHDGDILTDALRRMTDAPDSEGWQCVRTPEIDRCWCPCQAPC